MVVSCIGKNFSNSAAQWWQYIIFKPRISAKPNIIARAGVRQGNQTTLPILLPRMHYIGNRQRACMRKIVLLCVLPNNQRKAHILDMGNQFLAPSRCTLRSWRSITVFTCSQKSLLFCRWAFAFREQVKTVMLLHDLSVHLLGARNWFPISKM